MRHLDTCSAESHGVAADGRAPKKVSFAEGFVALTRRRDMAVRLIGASAAWFLMDFAYYGNTVSSPLVLHAVAPNDSLIAETLTQLGDLRDRRGSRLFRRRRDDRSDWAQVDPDSRLRYDGDELSQPSR